MRRDEIVVSALIPVILDKPINKPLHPHLNRRSRPIPDIADEIVDIRKRLGHIPELQRQKVLLRLAPQRRRPRQDVTAARSLKSHTEQPDKRIYAKPELFWHIKLP
jgi:hypothetical protein